MEFVKKDFLRQVNHVERVFEEFSRSGRLLRSRTVRLSTRYSFRYELQLLLEKAGFEVESLFRGYDKRPYDGTGEIIIVARKESPVGH